MDLKVGRKEKDGGKSALSVTASKEDELLSLLLLLLSNPCPHLGRPEGNTFYSAHQAYTKKLECLKILL